MIYKEVHRLGTHQDNKLFICFTSRLIPTANKSLPVFRTAFFFHFHFSHVFMCAPREPGSEAHLQFSPSTCGSLGSRTQVIWLGGKFF